MPFPAVQLLRAGVALSALGLVMGCRATPALELVSDPSDLPDLGAAFEAHSDDLLTAIDRSLAWLEIPASRARFDGSIVSHDRARASLLAMRQLLGRAQSAEAFAEEVQDRFEIHRAAGHDGRGTVHVTAYFAPEHDASPVPTPRFRYPLYRAPPDPSRFTRREIEQSGRLAGAELAWLDDPLDVYLIHVNGSARLRLPDGTALHVGHAATNGRPYTSLGRRLIEAGAVPAGAMSLDAIRDVYDRDPDLVTALMLDNDRFVFFEVLAADRWPRSALGIPLTAGRSIATDKSVFPPGGMVLVEALTPTATGRTEPLVRLMLDQDAGGAILGPGRADLYLGAGAQAGVRAGRQNHPGRLYYLFLARPRD